MIARRGNIGAAGVSSFLMGRPVQRVFVAAIVIAALVAGGRGGAAEDETAAAAARERPVSPRVAGLLSAALPKYTPAPATDKPALAETSAAVPTRLSTVDRPAPANGIVRLPDFVVRDRKPAKLPEPEEVMSRRDLEKIAMQRYLGDEQGLDRALSMVTPVDLWRRIPLLGRFPLVSFQTNEQRAMAMYEEAKMAERWAELSSLAAMPGPSAAPPKK